MRNPFETAMDDYHARARGLSERITDAELLRDFMVAEISSDTHNNYGPGDHVRDALDAVCEYRRALAELRQESGEDDDDREREIPHPAILANALQDTIHEPEKVVRVRALRTETSIPQMPAAREGGVLRTSEGFVGRPYTDTHSVDVRFPSREAAEKQARHAAAWERLERSPTSVADMAKVLDECDFVHASFHMRHAIDIANGAAPIPPKPEHKA